MALTALEKELIKRDFLIEDGTKAKLKPGKAAECAKYLLENSAIINGEEVGKMFSYNDEHDNKYNEIFMAYVQGMNFEDMEFHVAFRTFLEKFRLQGETGRIGKIMDAFTMHYVEQNKGANFYGLSVLANVALALNTDAHSPKVKEKMTQDQFINILRDTNIDKEGDPPKDFDREFLIKIYKDIKQKEIKPLGVNELIKSLEIKSIGQRYQEVKKNPILKRIDFVAQAKSRTSEIETVQKSVDKLANEYKTKQGDPDAIKKALEDYIDELSKMEKTLLGQKKRLGESRLLKVVQDLKKEASPQLERIKSSMPDEKKNLEAQAKQQAKEGEAEMRAEMGKVKWQKGKIPEHRPASVTLGHSRADQIRSKAEEAKTKFKDDDDFEAIMNEIGEGEFKYSKKLHTLLHITFTPPMDPGFEKKVTTEWGPEKVQQALELAEAVKAVIAAQSGSEESKKSVTNYLDKFIANLEKEEMRQSLNVTDADLNTALKVLEEKHGPKSGKH